MKTNDLMYQTMLAELGQRSLDAAWTADFPLEGHFTPVTERRADTGISTSLMGVAEGHGDMLAPQRTPRFHNASQTFKLRGMISALGAASLAPSRVDDRARQDVRRRR